MKTLGSDTTWSIYVISTQFFRLDFCKWSCLCDVCVCVKLIHINMCIYTIQYNIT